VRRARVFQIFSWPVALSGSHLGATRFSYHIRRPLSPLCTHFGSSISRGTAALRYAAFITTIEGFFVISTPTQPLPLFFLAHYFAGSYFPLRYFIAVAILVHARRSENIVPAAPFLEVFCCDHFRHSRFVEFPFPSLLIRLFRAI